MIGIRLRPHTGSLKETSISESGLVHSVNEKKNSCYIGEIDYDTSTPTEIDKLKPMVLKAFYSYTPAPTIPKLRVNMTRYNEIHEAWKRTITEIPIERQTALWLIRRIGFNKLHPKQDEMGLMASMDNIANPMIEIGNLMGLLIIKNGRLRLADNEVIQNIHLSKAVRTLSSTLFTLDVDMDSRIHNMPVKEREKLTKKINDLNKLLNFT
jgi:hypothetical protein